MKLDYEIDGLGMCHAQYFQGYGTAFTRFDSSVVGCGDTEREALNDALEQIAQVDGGTLADKIEASIKRSGAKVSDDSAYQEAVDQWIADHECTRNDDDECTCEVPDDLACELYVYVGLRWVSRSAYGSRQVDLTHTRKRAQARKRVKMVTTIGGKAVYAWKPR